MPGFKDVALARTFVDIVDTLVDDVDVVDFLTLLADRYVKVLSPKPSIPGPFSQLPKALRKDGRAMTGAALRMATLTLLIGAPFVHFFLVLGH